MNFTDLQNQTRILVGDTSTTFYTDAEVQNAINRVLPELASMTEMSLTTFYDYVTSAGTQRYSLQPDYLKVKQVDLIVTSTLTLPLKPVSLRGFRSISSTGTDQQGQPNYYKVELGAVSTEDAIQFPGDLWLFPTPDDNATANYTVRFYYYQLPTTLILGNDIPEFPIPLHMAICYKAASHLAFKGKDYQLGAAMETLYQNSVTDHIKFSFRPNRDLKPVVRDVMGYGDLDSGD